MKGFDYRTACMTLTGSLAAVAAVTAWVAVLVPNFALALIAGACLVMFMSLFVGIMNGG